MDNRPVIWLRSNRRHLLVDHRERRISVREVEEVMNDPDRIEVPSPTHSSMTVRGRTRRGRWLYIAYVNHPNGRLPIHFSARGAPKP